MYKKGQPLKLSKEGLDWLDGGQEGTRARLMTLRFEYHCRCSSKTAPNCISVTKIGTSHYQHYHYSFLELA